MTGTRHVKIAQLFLGAMSKVTKDDLEWAEMFGVIYWWHWDW